jgi:succinate dehydrogenase flavin-adding protein (antitoxin of CptAB toxin-antitoxin module)
MLTAEFVENAIKQLSAEELIKFRQWYAEFDADLWDAQIEADAAAGKLDALAEEALADYRSFRLRFYEAYA